MRHLIKFGGEELLVENLDGYPGCEVLEKDVPDPPSEFHERKGGRWVENISLRQRFEKRTSRLQKFSSESLPELAVSVAEVLEALEKKVSDLESEVSALKSQLSK